MQVLEKDKVEIEAKAEKMSDFLRMEYLESCSQKFHDIEIRRYCFSELVKLYEKMKMYSEAVKYIEKFKELCILQRERVQAIFKEMELFIKNGSYENAELTFRSAVNEFSEKDAFELKRKVIETYKQEADRLEKTRKISGALRIYEKLVHYLADNERVEVKRKILSAYKKLGKIRESLELERELERNGSSYNIRKSFRI